MLFILLLLTKEDNNMDFHDIFDAVLVGGLFFATYENGKNAGRNEMRDRQKDEEIANLKKMIAEIQGHKLPNR